MSGRVDADDILSLGRVALLAVRLSCVSEKGVDSEETGAMGRFGGLPSRSSGPNGSTSGRAPPAAADHSPRRAVTVAPLPTLGGESPFPDRPHRGRAG